MSACFLASPQNPAHSRERRPAACRDHQDLPRVSRIFPVSGSQNPSRSRLIGSEESCPCFRCSRQRWTRPCGCWPVFGVNWCAPECHCRGSRARTRRLICRCHRHPLTRSLQIELSPFGLEGSPPTGPVFQSKTRQAGGPGTVPMCRAPS